MSAGFLVKEVLPNGRVRFTTTFYVILTSLIAMTAAITVLGVWILVSELFGA